MERRPLLKHACDDLNTITNIMKVSVAVTSLKESEKIVYESLCKKNNSQEAEKSKDCKFRTYR